MENVKKLIVDALALLSTLSVSGDAVDVMAATKNKLRRAAEECKEDPDGR